MVDRTILNQAQAEDRLRYWQRVLRLQDWDLRVEVVRWHEFGQDGPYMGQMIPHVNKAVANIKLIAPDDASPGWMREYDMEKTLVHELLHIHFQNARPNDAKADERGEERAIEAIAEALIALDRRNALT